MFWSFPLHPKKLTAGEILQVNNFKKKKSQQKGYNPVSKINVAKA